MTVVIMNLFRGHKKCYFTILPTSIFEQFRQLPKFDKADLEVAHKLSKRIANIKFLELTKIHYNVMSRVIYKHEPLPLFIDNTVFHSNTRISAYG